VACGPQWGFDTGTLVLSALRNAPHLAGQPAKDSEKQLRPYGWVQRANEFMVVIAVMAVMAVMAKPFSDIKRQT